MPTYEYRCERCGETVEAVQSFSDAPLTSCASCGGPLRKVFAPVGIVFKGSGFYKTDSRSSARSRSKGADGAKEPATSSADGTNDAGSRDAGSRDAGSRDAGAKDSGAKDGGSKDSGSKDGKSDPASKRDATPAKAGARSDAKPAAAGAKPAPSGASSG